MSDSINNAELSANGWAAMPRSFTKSLAAVDKNKQAEPSVSDANPPSTDLAKKVHDFAKQQLPEKTFNHSMRVWYYGECGVHGIYESSPDASTCSA
jgi:cyanamide hydratase